MGLPTAEEARKYSTDIKNERWAKELHLCESKIQSAILKGELGVHIYESIGEWTKKHLRSLGYTVTSGMGRNETYTSISWADNKPGDE